MEIVSIEEQEDGSAIVGFDMTAEEVKALLQSAVVIGLTEGLKLAEKERMKELHDLQSETNMGNTQCRNPNCVYGPCVEPEQSEQSANSFKTSQVLG